MSSVSSTDCLSDISISPEALSRRALSANHTPMNPSYDFVLMNGGYSTVSAPEMSAGAGGDQLCMFEEKGNPETWSPLFEESNSPLAKEEPVTPPNLRKRSASEVSTTALEEDRARALSLESMRKKVKLSSPSASSSVPKKDLPPVVVQNPNDPAAVRRAKNTEAARRSRAKKNERIEHLESLVAELMSKNSMLEAENAVLRKFHKLAPR